MTSLTITTRPDIDHLLIAGRKAALAALYDQERNKTYPGSISAPAESYDGTGDLRIIGADGADVDIGPGVDAAVLEVVVQMGNPDPVAKRRAWWRFWA